MPGDSLELVMHLMFDGTLSEDDARQLVTIVGSLDLDVAFAARISEFAIRVE